MSNSIQPRHYTLSQATLLQQKPYELIKAVEGMADASATTGYARAVHLQYEVLDASSIGMLGLGGMGHSALNLVSGLTAGQAVSLVLHGTPKKQLAQQ